MSYHPHLHCIEPGGGPSPDGSRWIACRPNFVLPVWALSPLFRRVFLQALRSAFDVGQLLFFGEIEGLADQHAFARRLTSASCRDWVVCAKQPLGGPEQLLAYLSRYKHRVGALTIASATALNTPNLRLRHNPHSTQSALSSFLEAEVGTQFADSDTLSRRMVHLFNTFY